MKKRIYSIFLLLAVMTAGSAAAACGDAQTGNADTSAAGSGSETVSAETEAVTRRISVCSERSAEP